MVKSYGNFGNVYYCFGEYKEVIKCYEEVFEISIRIEDRWLEIVLYGNIGLMYGVLGDYDKVLMYIEKVFELVVELNMRKEEGI